MKPRKKRQQERTSTGPATVLSNSTPKSTSSQVLASLLGNEMQGTRVHVVQSIIVDRAPQELYNFWRNFQNLPRFMKHLQNVQVIDPMHSYWVAKAPAGITVEWNAEVVTDQPHQMITWRSLEGAEVDNAGAVCFEKTPDGRGTFVQMWLEYDPPGGKFGFLCANLFGIDPRNRVGEDLQRFKELMEMSARAAATGQSSAHKQTIQQ